MANDRLKLRLVMPTTADMELVSQDGGTIELAPVFYGPASSGPHLVVLMGDKIISRFKLMLKPDGRLELKRAL